MPPARYTRNGLRNASLTFVCRNVGLRVESSQSLFTAGYSQGQRLSIPVAHHEASEAKAICSGCPVWKECAMAACYEGDDFAVRGGMHPQARRKWARRLGLRVGRPAVAACGTDSGYYRHRTRGEEPCPDCRAAHAAKGRDWSRRAREAS